MAVLARQLAATGIRALPTGGYVRVLGEEESLVTALLDEARDDARARRVVGREVSNSEVDRASVDIVGSQ